MRRAAVLLLMLLSVGVAQAQPPAPKPFKQGSLREIVEARAGRPFILGFWSLDCVHCRAELRQFARLTRKHPALDVVLVSTDPPEAAAAVGEVLAREGLAHAEAWIFADAFVERLRFEVDRFWQGELPRTYLFDPDGRTEAMSGRVNPKRLALWLTRVGLPDDR